MRTTVASGKSITGNCPAAESSAQGPLSGCRRLARPIRCDKPDHSTKHRRLDRQLRERGAPEGPGLVRVRPSTRRVVIQRNQVPNGSPSADDQCWSRDPPPPRRTSKQRANGAQTRSEKDSKDNACGGAHARTPATVLRPGTADGASGQAQRRGRVRALLLPAPLPALPGPVTSGA